MTTHPPNSYVDNGTRDLTVEAHVRQQGDEVLFDAAGYAGEQAIVTLRLDPQGVEFLLNALPADDLFTKMLGYARDLARTALWDRNAR